jgi:hypothetical protein
MRLEHAVGSAISKEIALPEDVRKSDQTTADDGRETGRPESASSKQDKVGKVGDKERDFDEFFKRDRSRQLVYFYLATSPLIYKPHEVGSAGVHSATGSGTSVGASFHPHEDDAEVELPHKRQRTA